MIYKIVKLDRRMSGNHVYKYRIDVNLTHYQESARALMDARNWLWETYGPSSELTFTARNEFWAWDTEHHNRRIYLKSDTELTLFVLKFGQLTFNSKYAII